MKMMKHVFTLIEILTVAAIIAVLAGISVGVIGLISNKNAEAKTQATIKALELAMGQYKAEFGHPFFQDNKFQDIKTKEIVGLYIPSPDKSNNKLAGYMNDRGGETFKTSLIKFLDMKLINMSVKVDSSNPDIAYFIDGWGRPLIFRIPGIVNKTGFDLGSVGPDGKVGDGGTSIPDTLPSTLSDYDNFGKGDDITNFLR